jgi:hypothetical protein
MSIAVPSSAAGDNASRLDVALLDPATLPAPGQDYQLGSHAFSVTLTSTGTGVHVEPTIPWALEYHLDQTDMDQVAHDLSRLQLAVLIDNTWVPLGCVPTGDSLQCPLPELSTFALLVAPPASGALDTQLDNGWFFKQANGFSGAGSAGYSVVDDADASFWTEFERLGGVRQLGYPVSQRFTYGGLVTQAFQKLVLQWRPDLQQAVPLPVSDTLSAAGRDGWLQARYGIPSMPGPDTAQPPVLDAYPALSAFFENTDSVDMLGAPQAIHDDGTLVIVRSQYGFVQDWAAAEQAGTGEATVANAGDIAKAAGVLPQTALVPTSAPPTAADAAPLATP